MVWCRGIRFKVDIKVAGFTFTQVVALAPRETVDNMGLLSMTMDVEIAAKIFKHYFESAGQSKALAVFTKTQAREEVEAQKVEAMQLQEDKPDPKHLSIGNRVKVESVYVSQYSQQDERVDCQEGEQVEVERKEEGIEVAEEAEQEEARLKVAEEEAVWNRLQEIQTEIYTRKSC